MILYCKELAQQIKDEVKAEINERNLDISLAVIKVGNDPASDVYVRNKSKACEYVGIESITYELDLDTTEEQLLNLIQLLNLDDKINGILVQLPLPSHINESRIINEISPSKDVDCFHPINIGKMDNGTGRIYPCTPAGIIEILKRNNIQIEGKECVIIGRSNIVGKPISKLMLQENATVTIAHSKTKNLKDICRRADIIISAIGKPNFITSEFVKPGSVVIDVGINRTESGICGDVDFNGVKDIADMITPVPGGVGVMTVAMLMKNCLATV